MGGGKAQVPHSPPVDAGGCWGLLVPAGQEWEFWLLTWPPLTPRGVSGGFVTAEGWTRCHLPLGCFILAEWGRSKGSPRAFPVAAQGGHWATSLCLAGVEVRSPHWLSLAFGCRKVVVASKLGHAGSPFLDPLVKRRDLPRDLFCLYSVPRVGCCLLPPHFWGVRQKQTRGPRQPVIPRVPGPPAGGLSVLLPKSFYVQSIYEVQGF